MSNYFLSSDEVALFKNSEELKNTGLYSNLYEIISNYQEVYSMEQLP